MRHLSLLLHDGENPLNADADAHTRDFPALRVKHAHQAVISPAARHAAHAHTLLHSCSVLAFVGCRRHTCLSQHRLVNDACVIIQTSSQAEVKHHLTTTEEENTKQRRSAVTQDRDAEQQRGKEQTVKEEVITCYVFYCLLWAAGLTACVTLSVTWKICR